MLRNLKFPAKNIAAILIVAATLALQPTLALAQALTKVTVGVEFVNVRLAGLWVAEKEGFFKKQGLEINTVNISGGTQGVQAMVGGQLDLSFSAPAATIPAVAAGSQIVEIMPTTSTMPYILVGAPTVSSIPALKGQRVGASGSDFRLPSWR